MTAAPSAEVLAVGLATPVGLGSEAVAAAVRAGVNRFGEARYRNKTLEPQRMSLLADEHLRALSAAADSAGRAIAPRDRMLGLAAVALREACGRCPDRVSVLLALPEARPGVPDAPGKGFLRDLGAKAGVAIDEAASREYRQGGAAAMLALRDAAGLVAAGREDVVAVGGVDSLTERALLDALDAEGRLLGGSMDGLIPGEGAGFLLLGSRAAGRRLGLASLAQVAAVGLGIERGHRYSSEPYLGEGLAQALQALFAAAPGAPRVRCVYAGLNGEGLAAKEWGVAYLRSAERFADDFQVEHPADCLGDAGAALGPILLGLAAIGLEKGYREDPCLVWSTSDREARGAALLRAVT